MINVIQKQSNKLLSKKLKFLSWEKFLPKSLKFSPESNAGVVLDEKKVPKLFVFDTPAFLDVLSDIDDSLAKKLTHKEYYSKISNPAGYLIDEIESKVPENTSIVESLKNAVDESNSKGWIPFAKIQKELGLI